MASLLWSTVDLSYIGSIEGGASLIHDSEIECFDDIPPKTSNFKSGFPCRLYSQEPSKRTHSYSKTYSRHSFGCRCVNYQNWRLFSPSSRQELGISARMPSGTRHYIKRNETKSSEEWTLDLYWLISGLWTYLVYEYISITRLCMRIMSISKVRPHRTFVVYQRNSNGSDLLQWNEGRLLVHLKNMLSFQPCGSTKFKFKLRPPALW